MKKKLNTKYIIHSTSKSSGLTMIELLIVIAILALLLIVLLWSMRGQTHKARDAKRKADIDAYEKVFEEYFNDNEGYPVAGSIDNCNSADLTPYINRVMCDPGPAEDPYYYWTNASETAYALCADLESDTDPDIAASGCAAGCGPGGDYNYCVVVGDTIDVVGGDYDASEYPGMGGEGEYPYACVSGGGCDNVGAGSSCEYTFIDLRPDLGCYGLCGNPIYLCNP